MLRLSACLLILASLTLVASCKREERTFRVEPPYVSGVEKISVTNLFAGGAPATQAATSNEYEENAYALTVGKRLFGFMNCNGCHANGGGGMGPALMDDKWIYGDQPGQVFASIIQGRPNGMPSFATKLPDHQAWQLAAYVRSMSGLVKSDAAPGRSDHMQSRKAENSTEPESPKQSRPPQ
ncbi:MAG: cytochrome c oxidase cbb3-type subunit [Humisphaera sp.]|nr:cytochrome c oxidase cbb3-type subunit [Humisphaera sp.]